MRSDMTKVIVERPRNGAQKVTRHKFRVKNEVQDLDEVDGGPRKVSMKRPAIEEFGWDVKSQTDLLGPLHRFLSSQVGQKWDKIYSEICKFADSRSTMGRHLLQHVGFEVDFPVLKNGKVCDSRGEEFVAWGYRRPGLYVDPKNGTLCRGKVQKRWRKPEKVTKVFTLKDQKYIYYNGIWYRVQMELMPKNGTAHYDAILGSVYSTSPSFYSDTARLRNLYGTSPDGKDWYCVKKESASHREIVRLKKTLGADLAA